MLLLYTDNMKVLERTTVKSKLILYNEVDKKTILLLYKQLFDEKTVYLFCEHQFIYFKYRFEVIHIYICLLLPILSYIFRT